MTISHYINLPKPAHPQKSWNSTCNLIQQSNFR